MKALLLYGLISLSILGFDANAQNVKGSFKALLDPIYTAVRRSSDAVEVNKLLPLPYAEIAKFQKDIAEIRVAFMKLKPSTERDASIRFCNIADRVFAEEKACLDQINKVPLPNALQTPAEQQRANDLRIQNVASRWRTTSRQLSDLAKREYGLISDAAAADELQPLILLQSQKTLVARVIRSVADGMHVKLMEPKTVYYGGVSDSMRSIGGGGGASGGGSYTKWQPSEKTVFLAGMTAVADGTEIIVVAYPDGLYSERNQTLEKWVYVKSLPAKPEASGK